MFYRHVTTGPTNVLYIHSLEFLVFINMSACKYLLSIFELRQLIKENDKFINIHKLIGKTFNSPDIFCCLQKDLTLQITLERKPQ
jgi:hypothetical protein